MATSGALTIGATSSSAAAPTTTNVPPTTSTPPPTTTTTPPTTAPPTTTTEAQPTTSQPTTTTTVPTTEPMLTTSVTTSVPTTFFSTNAAGSTVIITTVVPSVFPTIAPNSGNTNTSSSNSHTAAIIGGAVGGGIAGIALLALFFYCIRRKVRKDDFDGNFDPDRVVGQSGGGGTLPRVDLADEVTPFPHPYSDHDDGSMRQRPYGEPGYMPTVPGSVGTPSDMYRPHGVGSSQEGSMPPQGYARPGVATPPGAYQPPMNVNMYGTGTGPADWHNPAPMASPPASTVASLATTSGRTTKEREAVGRGQGGTLGLATQPEGGERRDVVVHQDAGRAPSEEHPPPREIPPTYDSIRQD